MRFNLAFSPCPNDTFMFEALVNQKIDLRGLSFDVYMADIEELNHNVLKGKPDISKISFALYPEIIDSYTLLTSGSAIGYGNGPLLLSNYGELPDRGDSIHIAIPGEHTTANLLLNFAYPHLQNKKVYIFSDIEDAILNEEVDAGVIIHESRFTYQEKGLQLITDLGKYWESVTQLPVPLGGLAIRRDLGKKIQHKIRQIIHDSIQYALTNPSDSLSYIKENARELDEQVIRKHIDLYVNEFSLNLGQTGKKSIRKLLQNSTHDSFPPHRRLNIFTD